MGFFDKLADKVNDFWASAGWFAFCLFGVLAWVVVMAALDLWRSDLYHLALNSPTTALTFLGVYLGLNGQLRFENATNARWDRLFEHLGIEDPVDDDGQKP